MRSQPGSSKPKRALPYQYSNDRAVFHLSSSKNASPARTEEPLIRSRIALGESPYSQLRQKKRIRKIGIQEKQIQFEEKRSADLSSFPAFLIRFFCPQADDATEYSNSIL